MEILGNGNCGKWKLWKMLIVENGNNGNCGNWKQCKYWTMKFLEMKFWEMEILENGNCGK